MTTKWRDKLPVHPAAELFPLMSAEELRELAGDIKRNGLSLPVILWAPTQALARKDDFSLLDGRNRLDAAELAGLSTSEILKKQAKYLYGDKYNGVAPPVDPYEYVISANIHRRHLTAEQKRDLIARLLKATPEKSDREIGRQIKADGKTVAKVRADLEATAEFPQLKKRVGGDGKARAQPVKKKKKAKPARPDPRSQQERDQYAADSLARNFWPLDIDVEWNCFLSQLAAFRMRLPPPGKDGKVSTVNEIAAALVDAARRTGTNDVNRGGLGARDLRWISNILVEIADAMKTEKQREADKAA
jgi:ParB-like chromosome segregation protein Spo0J